MASTATPCGSGGGAGGITGPTSATIGNIVIWANAAGTQVGDSGVRAANLPMLGATQTWGGLNTYEVRPVFNGATPYDTANLPAALAPYLLSATAASTYETIAGAASTYLPLTGGIIPFLTLSAPAGTWKPISFNTGATQRWQVGSDNAAESGANTGSDFSIFSYADNGSVIANNLHITRATGATALSARPTFNGNLAWDAGNFTPGNYLTTAAAASIYLTQANAASTYLTQANAAATYTTPAEVNTALSTFLTIANAASTYLPLTGGIVTGGITVGGASTFTAATTFTDRINNNFGIFGSGSLTVGGAASFTQVPTISGQNVWYAGNFNPANYLTTAAASATYATISGVQSAYLRITDAASTYLTQANAISTYLSITNAAATYLTQAHAATTYFPLAGGTITGATQFNQTPTIANQSLPVTDSSPDVPTTSWTQSVITNRVGTGPFIPLTGVGMPYDIPIPYQGLFVPTAPMPVGYNVLTYVFVRKVVFPISFTGSLADCQNNATATTQLILQRTGSVAGEFGHLTFTPGSAKGLFTITSGTTTTFMPGDTLIILTQGSVANPAIADASLAGISGTLQGAISP